MSDNEPAFRSEDAILFVSKIICLAIAVSGFIRFLSSCALGSEGDLCATVYPLNFSIGETNSYEYISRFRTVVCFHEEFLPSLSNEIRLVL